MTLRLRRFTNPTALSLVGLAGYAFTSRACPSAIFMTTTVHFFIHFNLLQGLVAEPELELAKMMSAEVWCNWTGKRGVSGLRTLQVTV